MTTNFSRSYYIEFPASIDNWFTPNSNGSAGTIFPANINILQERTYVDKTMRNFRKIGFAMNSVVEDLEFTIKGYWENDGYAEKVLTVAEGEQTAYTPDLLLWIESIIPNVEVNGLKIGNLEGNTGWIYHDGSKFKNTVRIMDNPSPVTWTIKGTDKKIEIPSVPPYGKAPKPFNYESFPYNLDTNLTNQVTNTTLPIYVQMPVEALRMDVSAGDPGEPISGKIVWQYTTQNLI
jgi:hypothetical protein